MVKMNIHEIGWIDLAEIRNIWEAPVNAAINLRVS